MPDISVGSVAVDIVPDTRGFAAELKTKLSDISVEIGVTADTSAARAQIDEVARARSATINAEADTSAAEAQLDAAARTRDANIRADASSIGSVSTMLAGIVALGPALVPITAAVVGLTAALGAPLAAAGGGLTIFGLITGKAISETMKVSKQIDQLRQKARTLVDPKARADAAAQAKALEDSLTAPQKAFLRAKDSLSSAFDKLIKTSGGDIFRPVIQAMRLLGNLMPQLAPIIHSVSDALSGMLREIGDSAKSGGLKSFLGFLGEMAGPVLTTAATMLGNVAVGFAGLFKAFAPTSGALASGLLRLSGAFADFGRNAGSNKGLQSFIGYIQQVGPLVASTLGSLVKAIVHLGVALAPLGVISLGSIKVLADLISAIPTPVLTVLASLIGTVVLGLKAWAIVQGILNAVMDANPIGIVILAVAGLVAGLVIAYKNSETFRRIVDAAFRGVADAASFMWNNVIKPIFRFWLNTWFALIGAMVNGAAKAFGWVPGIGGKLKAAAAEFNAFRDRVNAALDGIRSTKEIHLNVTTTQSVKLSSINKPRVPMGATGAIVNRPTMAIIGEAGPEAVVPLDRTAGNSPLPTGTGVDAEQSYYRAFSRALANSGVVIMTKSNLDDLDLLVGSA